MGGLFPNDKGALKGERLRVIKSDADLTIVRLIRTESGPSPEEWTLLTARLGSDWPQSTGYVFSIGYTPMELEYLQGKRELGSV